MKESKKLRTEKIKHKKAKRVLTKDLVTTGPASLIGNNESSSLEDSFCELDTKRNTNESRLAGAYKKLSTFPALASKTGNFYNLANVGLIRKKILKHNTTSKKPIASMLKEICKANQKSKEQTKKIASLSKGAFGSLVLLQQEYELSREKRKYVRKVPYRRPPRKTGSAQD
jgi:hypothetical protein